MNREIKFRAWDVQKNEMHYFGVFSFEQFMFVGIRPDEVRQRVYPFDGIESGEMVTKDALNAWNLMQFTGLKDKNGKEIYEGDLLIGNQSPFIKANMPELKQKPYPVTFEKGTFMWRGEPLGWDTESNPPEICLPERWATVVGNIYEHSHLL